MTEEPLIWTTKGNLPIASLEYFTGWEDTEKYLKFVERYTLDGEVVKEGAHIYIKQGLEMNPETESF